MIPTSAKHIYICFEIRNKKEEKKKEKWEQEHIEGESRTNSKLEKLRAKNKEQNQLNLYAKYRKQVEVFL